MWVAGHTVRPLLWLATAGCKRKHLDSPDPSPLLGLSEPWSWERHAIVPESWIPPPSSTVPTYHALDVVCQETQHNPQFREL
jgi:hypothetical protein